MPISIGQPVDEGNKFKATIDLIDRCFKECAILIDDTVQRHTFKINDPSKDMSDLYCEALEAGNKWLERNKNIYESLKIPYKIIRWDDCLFHKEFRDKLNLVHDLYNNKKEYKTEIDLNIHEYITRNVKGLNISDSDYKMRFNLCLDYLKEECAAMTLWIENKYDFEVYPTGRNRAMRATYDHFIKPTYPDLLQSVSLRFKKINPKTPKIRVYLHLKVK